MERLHTAGKVRLLWRVQRHTRTTAGTLHQAGQTGGRDERFLSSKRFDWVCSMRQVLLVAFCLAVGLIGAKLLEWLITWRIKRSFDRAVAKVSQDVRSGEKPQPRKPTSPICITFDANGLVVSDTRSTDTRQMSWNEITRITAFKRDLLTVDCLCLLIADANGRILELNEEMTGWQELCEALPQHLPDAKPFHQWFMQAAFPAFVVSPTEIYARPDSQSRSS